MNVPLDRNDSSIDVRSVSYALRMRSARRALRSVSSVCLSRSWRLQAGLLDVEHRELEDQVVVGVLDDLDPAAHPGDLRLDRRQVGVDAGQLVPRRGDLGREPRLQRVELGDRGLLVRDLLLHRGGPGARVGQLVAAGGRRRGRRAEQPEDEREEQDEGRDPAPRRPPASGRGRPALGDRVSRSIGLAAYHVGDVIVRGGSVGRSPVSHHRVDGGRSRPPVHRRPGRARRQDDTGYPGMIPRGV